MSLLSLLSLFACTDGEAPVDCSKPDVDGDGFENVACDGEDCDDGDPEINPLTIDNGGDGVDADCDGADGVDNDGDGYGSDEFGGDDCDDVDPDVNPGAEDPVGDGVDTSCDGIDGVDADGDGFASEASGGGDCDDSDVRINPAASDGGAPGNVTAASFYSGSGTAIMVEGDVTDIIAGEIYKDGSLVQCRLVAATDASGSWTTTAIGDTLESSCNFGATRGDDGVAHVVYRNDGTALMYAVQAGGSWRTSTLAPSIGSYGVAVAVGSDGVYAAWVSSAGDVTIGAVDGGSSWTVASAPSGAVMDLYIDKEVHLLYVTSAGALMYARGVPGSEATESVASSVVAARMALGANPQVVYAQGDRSEADLVWAERKGSGWSAEVVESAVPSLYDLSIAVGADGGTHLVWTDDYYGSTLTYSGRTVDGVWTTLELVEDAGDSPSVVVDGEGDVHFSHFDGGDLFHTTIAGPNGVDDNCDGAVW